MNLTELIKQLIKIEGLARIRLSSIEVNEVTDELIALMKKERKLCRHLHIPLQSGCDKILKSMNRPYAAKKFEEKIKKIRRAMPDTRPVKSGVAGARDSERFNGVAVTTDLIVGFPGETEKDFQTTVRLIKKINFAKLHVFPFSAHERTPAAGFADQVAEAVKHERVRRMNALSGVLEKKYAKRFVGKRLAVIIDGRSRTGCYRGKTEYYFDVEFTGPEKYLPGQAVEIKNWKLL